MPATQTVSTSEVKAQCLNIPDRLDKHELDSVVITKRGRTIGVLLPPPAATVQGLCMRGSVIIVDDVDLIEPVLDEPLDAELGTLHR